MPRQVKNYGVWVAQPTSYRAETAEVDPKSPHISLKFDDGSGKALEAAINVKSIGKESRLVYWVDKNCKHPYLRTLANLKSGFHPLDKNKEEGLDYFRIDGLVNLPKGRLLPHDVSGPDNDILDQLVPILHTAIRSAQKIYLFGSQFPRKDGIHDVHMNQGSLPRFDNGIYQDGGIIIQYDDHWEAVFLAFASQKLPTDDDGLPVEDATSLAVLAENGDSDEEDEE